MGGGQSHQFVSPTDYNAEYRVTHSDVIRIQSILLGVQQSVSELQKKQDDLKHLVAIQNELFDQQNDIFKNFAEVIADLSKLFNQEKSEESFTLSNNNNNNDPVHHSSSSTDTSGCGSGSSRESVGNKNGDGCDLHPVHTPNEDKETTEIVQIIPGVNKRFGVTKKENTAIRVAANSGEGIRRLLILDITVILAKLTSANTIDSANQLVALLQKGPVLNFNQFGIVADTILEKTISEPDRVGGFARLIQEVNTKLSTEHTRLWRKALVDSYHSRLTSIQELQQEINSLRSTSRRRHASSSNSNTNSKANLISAAVDEKVSELKLQSSGAVIFISELFRNHMITPKELINVGDQLLGRTVNCDDEIAGANLQILLQRTGKSMDDILEQIKSNGCYQVGSRGNVITPRVLPNVNWMDTTFESLSNILCHKKNLSPTLLLSLSELVRLRRNKWNSAPD